MPNRTIYIKDEDIAIFNKAQEMSSDSISSIITESLRRYIVQEENRIRKLQEKAQIVGVVEQIFQEAFENNATDIYIQPTSISNKVRIRINGELKEISSIPQYLYIKTIEYIKEQASLEKQGNSIPQTGRFAKKYNNKNLELKVKILPTVLGETTVIQVKYNNSSILDINALEPVGEVHNEFIELINKRTGMIVAIGPESTGKTTTLYAMLNSIMRKNKQIVTVEEKIELIIDSCIQLEINPMFNNSFSLLQTAIATNPDVIMIGEISDKETAQLSIEASLKNSMVLTGLRIGITGHALKRLIDFQIDPYLINEAVISVINQRLVRQICQNCKYEYKISQQQTFSFNKKISKDAVFFKGAGCPHCSQIGYKGELPLFEILVPGTKLKQALLDKEQINNLQEIAEKEGMKTLFDDALYKATKGYTSLIEIIRVLGAV